MRRLTGLRDLVHDTVDAISTLVQDTQHASFERSVAALSKVDALRKPAQAADAARRAISGVVFDTIRGSNRTVQRVGDAAAAAVQATAEIALGDDRMRALNAAPMPFGASWIDAAQGALNAALGDVLLSRGNSLAIEMALYHAGIPLPVTSPALAEALPTATSKVCIFVHGLGCTESAWWVGAREYHADPDVSLGVLLARERGYTPLYVRYNTGRHVSENGRELAALLGSLDAAYPGGLRELVLVGHSMGGLVARSAAHYARLSNERWLGSLTHLLCIGSPHTGSFVEKSAQFAALVLHAIPTAGTQVPAAILRARSVGIQDLRFGYVVDEDWTKADPEAWLTDARHDIPVVPTVTYGFIASTYVREADHPLASMLGDLLVQVGSASGEGGGRVRNVHFDLGCVLPGVSHLALLNHPDVYRQLLTLLSFPRASEQA